MKEAIKHFVPKLVPERVRPALIKAYRPLALSLAAKKYKRRHGKDFIPIIDKKDEMLANHYEACNRLFPQYYFGVRAYLGTGEMLLQVLENTLKDLGYSFRQIDSFLEFACGYGRFTRFLIQKMDSRKVTVSDIDKDAVDFVVKTFGVNGFYSVTQADKLAHDGKYDVIYVVSLFSHLAISNWEQWFKRLYAMLKPNGLLIFTTHGMSFYNRLPEEQRTSLSLEMMSPGFLYGNGNETAGRLTGDHYGTAFVSEQFVKRFVDENAVGRLVKSYPDMIHKVQDLYVVRREESR